MMTQTPGTVPAPVTRRPPDTATRLLACLAVVLGAMALALLLSGVLISPLSDSTSICGTTDATTADCLLAVRMGRLHTALIMNGATALAVGAVASALGALVVRGLPR